MLRCCDYLVKGDVTLTNILQDLFVADNVGSLSLAILMEFGACEHADPYFLACTCRQHAGATDVLITLCRVNIELNLNFKTLDKLALLRNFAHFREDLSRAEFIFR